MLSGIFKEISETYEETTVKLVISTMFFGYSHLYFYHHDFLITHLGYIDKILVSVAVGSVFGFIPAYLIFKLHNKLKGSEDNVPKTLNKISAFLTIYGMAYVVLWMGMNLPVTGSGEYAVTNSSGLFVPILSCINRKSK